MMGEPPFLIAAVFYERGQGEVMDRLAARATASGLRLAGLLQKNGDRPDRRRCDMTTVDLATGKEIPISEDRGREARGCRLDHGALEQAAALVAGSLDAELLPDLLVLSKFGKREAEGHGLRQVMARAVERGVPVIIGVGEENLTAFEAFAAELGVVFRSEAEAEAALLEMKA